MARKQEQAGSTNSDNPRSFGRGSVGCSGHQRLDQQLSSIIGLLGNSRRHPNVNRHPKLARSIAVQLSFRINLGVRPLVELRRGDRRQRRNACTPRQSQIRERKQKRTCPAQHSRRCAPTTFPPSSVPSGNTTCESNRTGSTRRAWKESPGRLSEALTPPRRIIFAIVPAASVTGPGNAKPSPDAAGFAASKVTKGPPFLPPAVAGSALFD